jgi:hypothetical protein
MDGVGGSETMLDLVKDAETRLGTPPTCRLKSANALEACIFESPPAAPELKQAKLHGGIGGGSGNRALNLMLELIGKP